MTLYDCCTVGPLQFPSDLRAKDLDEVLETQKRPQRYDPHKGLKLVGHL